MPLLTIERDDEYDRPRGKRPVELRLDGRAWLRVNPEQLAALGLTGDVEIDGARTAAAEQELARMRARLFVVRSLAARPQSVAELERKLAARGIPDEVAREAIDAAIGYRYLDDAELAGQLARGLHSRRYGRRRTEQALRARGIPGEEADAALQEAYGEEDEVALARAAIGRRTITDDEPGKLKAVAFLARRGFSTTAAWQAVKEELADRRPG